MAVLTLRPNVDITSQWERIGGLPSDWQTLYGAPAQEPAPGDGFYLRTDTTNEVVEVGVDTGPVGSVTQVKVWAYTQTDALAGAHTVRLLTGAVELASVVVPTGAAGAWRSATYVGSLTQAQVDDLRIRDTYSSGNILNYAYIDDAYIEVTHTPLSAGGRSVVATLLADHWL